MSIDDLFKKLSGPPPQGSIPPFHADAWKKMELLLDKELPQKKRFLFPFVFISCVLSLLVLTTFLPVKLSQKTVAVGESVNKRKVITQTSSLQQKEAVAIPSITINPSAPILEITKNKIQDDLEVVSNSSLVVVFKKDRNETKQMVLSTIKPVTEIQLKVTDSGGHLFNTIPKQVALKISNYPNLSAVPNIFTNTSTVITPKNKSVATLSFKNNISVTINTGFESSGTSLAGLGRVTPVLGFGIQYTVRNKVLFRTGINRTKKIYSAQDREYNPPAGFWANNFALKRIEADCNIIEIPLSVAYRVRNVKQGALFLSLGTTSYFMKKEVYKYFYKNQLGNDTVRTNSWSNRSKHLFSSVTMSVIAEKIISNRFSIQAEPQLSIPIQGVGFGKVRLFSTGINISAKFKIK